MHRAFQTALAFSLMLAATGAERLVESVVPSLSNNALCWSSVDLHNLGERTVTVELEAHKATGALAGFVGRTGNTVRLPPGRAETFRLDIGEHETTQAWVKVRERIPSPDLSSVVAVAGKTECIQGRELHTLAREIAYPIRNPWFETDTDRMAQGEVLALINASEYPARGSLCYSSGSSFAVPDERRAPEQKPLCIAHFDVLIPPFGSSQFPLHREGASHFSMTAIGQQVVLQTLHPADEKLNVYAVDSTITFGEEAPPRGPRP